MPTKRIVVAITARASYSRIRSFLLAVHESTDFELQVLVSGSAVLERFGAVVENIKRDGFTVIDSLYTSVEGGEPINMALTAANTIAATALTLRSIRPDYVVTVADRYETIGTAIAASYLGLPLIHIQGGEVTGNIDEKVRHAITKLADVHFVANRDSARRVIQMGEAPEQVYVTGCPSLDLVEPALDITTEDLQSKLNENGVGADIDLNSPFIVISQHPETEFYAESFQQMSMTLEASHLLGLPQVILWPNIDAGSDATSKAIRVAREAGYLTSAKFVKNLDGLVFLKLLSLSACLMGNSSVGLRECGLMGVPVVNAGIRQSNRARGQNVIDVPWSVQEILAAALKQTRHGSYEPSTLYGTGSSHNTMLDCLRILKVPPMKFFKDLASVDPDGDA